MTNRVNILILPLLAATFLFGCGTDGTISQPLPNVSLNYDFRVVSTTPTNGATNIDTGTITMQVYFSEEVEATSVQNNILVQKEVNGQTQTIPTVINNTTNNLVDIQLETTQLDENTLYHVVFLPGLSSTTANQLYDGDYPEGVEVVFNTGVGFGNSVSGPPEVTSIQQYNNFNGCFSAIVRFSEDVDLLQNDITISSTLLFGTGGGQIDAMIYPYYQTRQDAWIVDGQCNLLGVWDLLQQIKVQVHDAVDLEGNHLDCSNGNCQRTF